MASRFFEVVLVIAVVMHQLAVVHVQDVLGELADEIDVMADENECAFVGFQRADQRIDARHIEVRRRLVH